jgi:hypothetical protein
MLKTRECKLQHKDSFKFKNTSLFTKLLIKKSKHFKKIKNHQFVYFILVCKITKFSFKAPFFKKNESDWPE